MSWGEYHIGEVYRHFLDGLDKDAIKYVINFIEHHRKEYKIGKLNHKGYEVASSFNYLIDDLQKESLKEYTGKPISCKKGCSFCCYLHVDITEDEADLILYRQGIMAINWDRLKIQETKNIDTWEDLSQEDKKCVFLDDSKQCSIYDYRPSYCRLQLSVDKVKNCDVSRGVKKIANYFAWQPESVAVAVHNSVEGGTFARMLIEAKER